jgi:hypothetical protein
VLPVFPLGSLEKTLRSAGLSITHPSTHLVTVLDSQGDQFSLSLDAFRRALGQDHGASFQWWLADDHDVYCRIREVGGISVIELGMEGCSPTEIQGIRRMLEDFFGLSDESSVGLVFDPQGVAEDYDWDRFFVHRERLNAADLSRGFPEVLGVKLSDFERVDCLPSDALVVDKGSWVICSMDLG